MTREIDKRNEGQLVDRRIEKLRPTYSHRERVDGIWVLNAEIQQVRETYDVESSEDLAIELEPGDEGWGDVGRWQATRWNLALAKAALQVTKRIDSPRRDRVATPRGHRRDHSRPTGLDGTAQRDGAAIIADRFSGVRRAARQRERCGGRTSSLSDCFDVSPTS